MAEPYLSYTSSGVSKSSKKTTIAGGRLTRRWSAEDAPAFLAYERYMLELLQMVIGLKPGGLAHVRL